MKTESKNFFKKRIRIILIMGALFIASLGISQLVVTDPGNDAANRAQLQKIIQQIEEAREQTAKLSSMKNDIQKNINFLQEVNQNIKNIERVKRIAENQAKIYNQCFEIKNKFAKSNHLEVILQAEQVTNNLLQQTQSNISELSQIVNNGFFNMNDAERLENIRNHEKETNSQLTTLSSIQSFMNHYEFALDVYNSSGNTFNNIINNK
jgi:DNA repair exonuclease SbcCD ATPase subunit